MEHILYSMDFFKIPFQFNIDNRILFSSKFSQILTFLFFLMFIFVLSINLNSMFSRKNLIISNYRTSVSDKDKLVLNESVIFFAFGLFDENLQDPYDKYSEYIEFKAEIVSNWETTNSSIKNLEIINCNYTLNRHIFLKYSRKPKYCINFNNSLIKGNTYDNIDNYSSFIFKISFNYNKYYKEFANQTLPNFIGNLGYFYPISSLTLENYDKPFEINLGFDYLRSSAQYNQLYQMFFSIDEIHTYGDYLKTDKEIVKTLYSANYNYNKYEGDPDAVFKIYFNIFPIKSIYYRRYLNLQDVINNVNSTMSLIFFLLNLIATSFNQMKLKQKIIKHIFSLKTETNDKYIGENDNKLSGKSIISLKRKADSIRIRNKKTINFKNYLKLFMKSLCCSLNEYETKRKLFYDDLYIKLNTLTDVREILKALKNMFILKRVLQKDKKLWKDYKYNSFKVNLSKYSRKSKVLKTHRKTRVIKRLKKHI